MRKGIAEAALAASLLAGCSIEFTEQGEAFNNRGTETVEDLACLAVSETLGSSLDYLPGSEVRQDLNPDPVFRANTISIAGLDGYGSGALFRDTEGVLSVRTVRHVSEPATASDVGGIFFPGVGWWEISGCDLDGMITEQVGGSVTPGLDSIVDIRLPDDISGWLEDHIDAGVISPLIRVNTSSNIFQPSENDGSFSALIPIAEIGEYSEMKIDPSYVRGDDHLDLIIDGEATGYSVCSGQSGQAILLSSGDVRSKYSIGAVSQIYNFYELGDGRYCSDTMARAISYTE